MPLATPCSHARTSRIPWALTVTHACSGSLPATLLPAQPAKMAALLAIAALAALAAPLAAAAPHAQRPALYRPLTLLSPEEFEEPLTDTARRRLTDAPEPRNLKIALYYEDAPARTDVETAYLKDTLMPAAVAEVSRLLRVRNPRGRNLRFVGKQDVKGNPLPHPRGGAPPLPNLHTPFFHAHRYRHSPASDALQRCTNSALSRWVSTLPRCRL